VVRPLVQYRESPPHAGDVAAVKADPVDVVARDDHRAPRQRPLRDLGVQLLAARRGEQLGVGEPLDPVPSAPQDHRRDDERPRARPPSRLVDARDGTEPGVLQGTLIRVQPCVAARRETKRTTLHATQRTSPHPPPRPNTPFPPSPRPRDTRVKPHTSTKQPQSPPPERLSSHAIPSTPITHVPPSPKQPHAHQPPAPERSTGRRRQGTALRVRRLPPAAHQPTRRSAGRGRLGKGLAGPDGAGG